MRKAALFMLCVFACSLTIHAQKSKDKRVKPIDKQVKQILADTNGPFKLLNNEEFMQYVPDGGGSLKICFGDTSVICIDEWIGLSYGIINTLYFFQGGKLIFVLEKELTAPVNDKSGERDYSSLKQIFEGGYYFENERLFATRKTGKRTFDEEMFYDSNTKEGVLITTARAYLGRYGRR